MFEWVQIGLQYLLYRLRRSIDHAEIFGPRRLIEALETRCLLANGTVFDSRNPAD